MLSNANGKAMGVKGGEDEKKSLTFRASGATWGNSSEMA
jgi:hypothetical protein